MKNAVDHIRWIDGLKGIAAMGILWHHLIITAYPASYSGDPAAVRLYAEIELFLAQSPLAAIINGNFYMFLFLFLSGYVMAYQGKKTIGPATFLYRLLKRYIRLAGPLLAACLISLILFKLNLLQAHSFPLETPTLLMALKSAFYRILLFGDQTFGGIYWMLGDLFCSTLFAALVLAAVRRDSLRLILFFLLILLGFARGEIYQAAVFLGTFCCLTKVQFTNKELPVRKEMKQILSILLFAAAFFLAGYPSGMTPTNVYHFLDRGHSLLAAPIEVYQFWHLAAVLCLYLSIESSGFLQKRLESPVCLWISRYSYGIYVFQVIVINLILDRACVIFARVCTPWSAFHFLTAAALIQGLLFGMSMGYTQLEKRLGSLLQKGYLFLCVKCHLKRKIVQGK